MTKKDCILDTKISRSTFLKNVCRISICPVFMSFIASSCGTKDDSSKDQEDTNLLKDSVTLNLNETKYIKLQEIGGVFYLEKSLPLLKSSILLYRKSNTECLAFSNICPHAGYEVSINDNRWVCSGHGSVFNEEGIALTGSARGKSLISYSTTLKENMLTIYI